MGLKGGGGERPGAGSPSPARGYGGSAASFPIGAWGGATETFTSVFCFKPRKKLAYSQRSKFYTYVRKTTKRNAPRNGRQQAAENIGYARVSKPYFSFILSLGCRCSN